MNKKLTAIAAAGLLAAPMAGYAVPVSFGALSSDDSGSTQIISDSLNNYEWLRWDVLGSLSYAETLNAISSGGQYEGWQFARANEAQGFTNALLLGLTNSCTVTGSDTCNELLPNDLTGLLGDTFGGVTEEVSFVTDGEGGAAGFMQYVHEGDFGSLYKSNEGSSTGRTGWLLYRTGGPNVPPPANVPEPGTFALFAAGIAGIGFLRRRRPV